MRIFVKNMVSSRCKIMVKGQLEQLGVSYSNIELGEVEIDAQTPVQKILQLKRSLEVSGLEVIDNKNTMLSERIKKVVIEMIDDEEELPELNISEFLSKKLGQSYRYLSAAFSQAKGITIGQYIILYKIDRAKEMLMYDQLTLSEIGIKLKYSSSAHLSHQFKKITGFTPSFFKTMKEQMRLAS